MTYRIIRYLRQVTDSALQYEMGASISSDARAAEEAAEAIGCALNAITVEHVEAMPPVEYVIAPAPSAPLAPIDSMTAAEIAASSPPPGPLETMKTIMSKPVADRTTAEAVTVLWIMAAYFYRKWMNGWR